MMRATRLFATALLFAALPWAIEAQAFGFGEGASATEGADSGAAAAAAAPASVKLGGEVDLGASAFFVDFEDPASISLGDLASASLSIEAKGASVEAGLSLKASKGALSASAASLLDEAYLRAFLGPITLEGGLLKLSWGKADSMGPLNVLNPMDYSDLSVTDERSRRIAEPMLHLSAALGTTSKLELAFLPGFEGDQYAWDGAWAPKAIKDMKAKAYAQFYSGANPTLNGGRGDGLYNGYYMSVWSTAYSAAYSAAYTQAYAAAYAQIYAASYAALYTQYTGIFSYPAAQAAAAATADIVTMAQAAAAQQANAAATTAADQAAASQASAIASTAATAAQARVDSLLDYPDTRKLDYAQGGLRFTTSFGGFDLGLQYFYGFLTKPVISSDPAVMAANDYRIPVSYNRYHQAGLDLAAVLAGFNVRAEAAANITDDFTGDDPNVYNQSLAFSLGIDRDLFAGLNLNLQYSGSYILEADAIASDYDVEKGADEYSSRLTAALSQSLFKDALSWKVAGVWGVNDMDFLVMPSVTYALGDVSFELGAGVFGGEEEGELGQYADESYLKLGIVYKF